jgi:uncharacterized RDD family membrane protein YckC
MVTVEPNGAGFEQFPADASQNYLQTGYAGAGRRLGALVLDFLIVGIVTGILFAILFNSSYSSYIDDVNAWIDNGQVGAQPTPDTSLTVGLGLFLLVLWFVYRTGMEITKGASLGKMAVGIKVVDADGQKVSVQSSLLRNSWYLIVSLVSALSATIGSLLYIVIPIILGVQISRNQFSQHICDQWGKSYVIRSR